MTGIVGIIGPQESTVVSALEVSLGAMKARGSIAQSAKIKGDEGFLAIGSCSHAKEKASVNNPERTSIVVDGTLGADLELEEVGGQTSEESLSEMIDSPSGFSFLSICVGRLVGGRDVLGQKPLYFGAGPQGLRGCGSLKSALQEIGIPDPRPLVPGQLSAITRNRLSVLKSKVLAKPRVMRVSEAEASTKLRDLLVDALSDEIPRATALAFSGGLDSTLVAQASKDNDLRPELITVGLKGRPELDHARKVAKQMSLDLTVRELSEIEVLDALPEVVKTIESVDPVIVGVSVPLYFVCEAAQEMGMECLLAGQLSDELFAGYGRFDELAKTGDFRKAGEEVWKSVHAAATNDFEPGDKLAVSHQLELRCPFAFLPLVKYALQLPMSLKLKRVGRTVVRKYILRRLAADWNLPKTVVDRPKKAVQYSSGVQKTLLKEAKKRKMSLGRFLESLC